MEDINTRDKTEALLFDEIARKNYAYISDESLTLSERLLINDCCNKLNIFNTYSYALYLLKYHGIIGQEVLNIACGDGSESIILASMGAKMIHAFDISPLQIQLAKKRSLIDNLSERIDFRVMSVYDLKYSDSKFSLVYGYACLHHFDIAKAAGEISRVMKQGGIAIFAEPFAGSLMMQRIRDMIPVKNDAVSPYERQLTNDDLMIMSKYFQEIQLKEFGLLNRIDRIINHKKLLNKISKIDSFILDNCAFCRRFARDIVIKAVK
jgi:ubiquinone/menaquinone biosynthesis C-methylase UbiE